MQVNVITLPTQRVATIRHVGPYNQIGKAFSKLGPLCEQAQLLGPYASMLAIFHDDPKTTPEDELRSDAGIVVSPHAVIPSSLSELELPAGQYAVAIHVGSYSGLGDAWARYTGQWLPQSGYRRGEGVAFEKYLNTPQHTAEAELRTELYLPLAVALG